MDRTTILTFALIAAITAALAATISAATTTALGKEFPGNPNAKLKGCDDPNQKRDQGIPDKCVGGLGDD